MLTTPVAAFFCFFEIVDYSYVEEGLMSIRNETDRINALEQLLRRLGKMIENTHEHVDYGLAIKSLG